MLDPTKTLLDLQKLSFTPGEPDELKLFFLDTEETWMKGISFCRLTDGRILLFLGVVKTDEIDPNTFKSNIAILKMPSDLDIYFIEMIEPLLIRSHSGSLLGFIKNTDGIEIVVLKEGDDGWDERLGE